MWSPMTLFDPRSGLGWVPGPAQHRPSRPARLGHPEQCCLPSDISQKSVIVCLLMDMDDSFLPSAQSLSTVADRW